MALATWLALTVPLHARSLKQAIPSLFGGSLATSIDFSDLQDAQRPRVADRFRSLSADLATARLQAPIPSASGAFRFSWNPGLDTFVRFQQSLGVPFAERAQTLGKGSFSFGLSYSRVDFDTVEGDRLGSLSSRQPALSDEFLEQLPGMDVPRFDDDVLETQLSLDFAFDLFFVSAAYGLTDTIDIGLALSINRVRMRAQALAAILDSDGEGDAFFAANQPGAITDGVGPICGVPFK